MGEKQQPIEEKLIVMDDKSFLNGRRRARPVVLYKLEHLKEKKEHIAELTSCRFHLC